MLPRAFYYWLAVGLLGGLAAALAMNWEVLFPVPHDRLVTLYRRHGCPCFRAWAEHLEEHGFIVRVFELDRLEPARTRLGDNAENPGCHFAVAGGYFIEGHVLAEDVRRLLAEKPKARGIAIVGNPTGLPGLQPTSSPEPYDVALVDAEGRSRPWVRHDVTAPR